MNMNMNMNMKNMLAFLGSATMAQSLWKSRKTRLKLAAEAFETLI